MIFTKSPVVLDPNVKLAYAEDKWDVEQLQDAINHLETVVCLFLVVLFNLVSYLNYSLTYTTKYQQLLALMISLYPVCI